MHFSKKLIAGCVLSLLGCVNLHALQITVCQVDPKKQNATVYLRWTGDNYTNGDVRYTVQRSLNGGNWETLATNLERLEYFDQSVKPGEQYKYMVTSTSNGSATTDKTLTIPNRNHSHPVYSLNVEYEISFDELLLNGWEGQGFHIPTHNKPGNKYKDVSWNAKGDETDEYNHKFLPKSTYYENNYSTEQLAGYGPENFYLDGNRYLWIKDGQRSTGEKYKCEIPNFRVNGDYVRDGGYTDVAKTSEAAERYPWAGVGYSWRETSARTSNTVHEKCWYINIREDNKYGVLCVWGPDQMGRRPYAGQPFYLDWAKFRSDYSGSFNDKTFGTTWPNRNGIANSADETYSVAFSDDGRSYLRRTGFGDISRRSVFFSIHSNKENGRRHDWKPERSESRYTYLRSDKDNDLPGGNNLTSGRADLLNVKGNLRNSKKNDDFTYTDPTQDQNYAWIWQITNYVGANNQVIVRGDRINRDGDITKGDRIRLQGFNSLYGSTTSGYKGNQNYVVPMSGKNCDDIFVQLSNSGRTPSENYPHLYYLYSNLINSTTGAIASTNNEYYTITRDVTNATDIQRIDLGIQYNHIVGGCTFDFKGDKFLILPATRQGDYNMGDFTIFRIDNRNGNSNVTLTPVINYTSPAIQNKQWSSTAGKGANPNRTFIRTFLKSENRAGFDNEDQYVEIYVYLPGRTINMYTFYGTKVPDGAPKVEMLPNIVTNEEYLYNQNYQYLLHYDVVTGEVKAKHSDNTTAPHLKEFYTHIDWTGYRGEKFNNSTARDTKVLLSELQSTNYLQKTDGNWDTYTPYQSRTDAGSADYWNLTNHLGGQYGTSIWTRPQYKRNVAGKTQVLYGNNNESNSRYYYSPKPVKNLSVKAYHNGSGNDINNATTYRVDINFDAPDEVWGHNENSHNRPNGGNDKIPVTRYEIWAEGQGGLTTKANNKIAYVMTGNTAYPNYVKGEVYHKGNFYAVQAKDQTIKSGNYSNTAVVIPGNYDFNNKNNTMYAAVPGNKDDGKEKCVVSIISTNPSICNDTYRVRAVYGTDNWNGPVTESAEYGVSKYADVSAVPATASYTGVDDILSDNVTDGEDVYYTLQGIRLEGQPTAPGIYLRHNSAGTSKVYFH